MCLVNDNDLYSKNEYLTANAVLTLEKLREAYEIISDPIKFEKIKRKKDFYNQLFTEIELEEKKND